MSSIGALFGTGTIYATESIQETYTPVKKYTGPFCVEVYSPHKHKDRSLPIFDNLKQARNMALARMSIIQKDMANPARAGKILITKPNGEVAECMTWGTGWSQTVCYIDCNSDNLESLHKRHK